MIGSAGPGASKGLLGYVWQKLTQCRLSAIESFDSVRHLKNESLRVRSIKFVSDSSESPHSRRVESMGAL